MPTATANNRLSQIRAHIPHVESATSRKLPPDEHHQHADPVKTQAIPNDDKTPLTILVFGWGGSSILNLQKCITTYKTLYRSAMIFPFPSPFSNMLPSPLRTSTQRETGFDEAMSTIQKYSDDAEAKVVIHVFSNGGSYGAALFANRYLRSTGMQLPLTALIFDSAPERTSIPGKSFTISHSMVRGKASQLFLQFVLFILLALERVFTALTWQNEPTVWTYRVLNNEAVFRREARRCYIFSREDKVTDWREVVKHAEEAKERGFGGKEGVMIVEVQGGKHVQHMRKDQMRYWSVVQKVISF